MEGFLVGFLGQKLHKICKSTLLVKTLKIVIFPRENAYFQEIEHQKKKTSNKNRRKIACFLGPRFWMDLGRVLGRFWEAQIINFRSFFDIFSKQNFECNLEGQKNSKKYAKMTQNRNGGFQGCNSNPAPDPGEG